MSHCEFTTAARPKHRVTSLEVGVEAKGFRTDRRTKFDDQKPMPTNRTFAIPGSAVNRPLTKLRSHVFAISPAETSFLRRGFRSRGDATTRRLEGIGQTFLRGYHAALIDESPVALASELDACAPELRGFAYEGAAMGLALLDELSPWGRRRLPDLLDGAGRAHAYMIHVGAGWAIARVPWLRWSVWRAVSRLDPLLRWLAVDGYGFHEGYFHWREYSNKPARLNRLHGYARHAFAQGLGRCLWFIEGAEVARIATAISMLPPTLEADLWSGVGLACTYAGGVDRASVSQLRELAGTHQAKLAQGAAFAAKTRQRAGNTTEHTEMACEVLCGMTAAAAAEVTDVLLEHLPEDGAVPAYEIWRQRIQSRFVKERMRS